MVHTPEGVMTAKAILINCCVDLPARAILLNMKPWNGQHGYLFCESPGSTVPGDHLHRYWTEDATAVNRTHTSLNGKCCSGHYFTGLCMCNMCTLFIILIGKGRGLKIHVFCEDIQFDNYYTFNSYTLFFVRDHFFSFSV